MEYKGLGPLLEKFKALIQKSGLEKSAMIDSISAVCGFAVDESMLKISGTVLHVGVMGPKKTMLLLKKVEVLASINQSRTNQLTDIR